MLNISQVLQAVLSQAISPFDSLHSYLEQERAFPCCIMHVLYSVVVLSTLRFFSS